MSLTILYREPWNWKEKVHTLRHVDECESLSLTIVQKYIRATRPGSKFGIKFTSSLGSVQLHYLKSAIFGLGTLRCWVDDDVEKAMDVPGYWGHSHNIGV